MRLAEISLVVMKTFPFGRQLLLGHPIQPIPPITRTIITERAISMQFGNSSKIPLANQVRSSDSLLACLSDYFAMSATSSMQSLNLAIVSGNSLRLTIINKSHVQAKILPFGSHPAGLTDCIFDNPTPSKPSQTLWFLRIISPT